MNANGITSVAAAIVGVALVTTIVSHPESANVIRAVGRAFSDSLNAAMGRGVTINVG